MVVYLIHSAGIGSPILAQSCIFAFRVNRNRTLDEDKNLLGKKDHWVLVFQSRIYVYSFSADINCILRR